MERKYLLKLDGRFAGRGEIFTESEICMLREWVDTVKQMHEELEESQYVCILDRLSKVFEIRSIND